MTTVDGVLAALADPTRRSVLESLVRDGATTATVLARRLPVTRQAVGKHLSVLERAGLVHCRRVGREARYQPDPAPLTSTAQWLAGLAREWDERLDHIRAVAENPET